ncbi:MAG: hypothetical protein ACP5GC_07330 [Thiomonas sp.]
MVDALGHRLLEFVDLALLDQVRDIGRMEQQLDRWYALAIHAAQQPL